MLSTSSRGGLLHITVDTDERPMIRLMSYRPRQLLVKHGFLFPTSQSDELFVVNARYSSGVVMILQKRSRYPTARTK